MLQLKQEIDLVHQSSIKAFARALAKVRRPEVDTHTLRNGTLTEHDFADTINLLLSIGEQTVTAINSDHWIRSNFQATYLVRTV